MELDIMKFELKEEHLKLLANTYIGWNDCETGAPSIDCKRPYGNSYVEGDVAEILGWKFDRDEGLSDKLADKAMKLHQETEIALQIVLKLRTFKPGIYVRTERYDTTSWVRKK